MIQLQIDDVLNNNKKAETIMKSILSTKYNDWKYEREVRLFYSLEEKEKEDGFYFYNYKPYNKIILKEIIFGPDCLESNKDVFDHINTTDITVFSTQKATKKYAIIKK